MPVIHIRFNRQLAITVRCTSIVATCVRHWVTNGNLGNNFNDIVLRNQTVTDEFYKPLL